MTLENKYKPKVGFGNRRGTCFLWVFKFTFSYLVLSCTTEGQPPSLKRPDSPSTTKTVAGQPNQQDARGGLSTIPSSEDEDIDVGGYTEKETTSASVKSTDSTGTQTSTSTSTAKTPAPPPKGVDASERHDGQITFQSRLQPFKMTISSMVRGKTVATKEFTLGDRDNAKLTVPGLCVTSGKTCLVVTLNGGVSQTAGKAACAKAEVKGPTSVFINSDVDGPGIIGSCFEDATDMEDAFTITCPNSSEMVMGTCASG